jgi:hypothetical protein
MMIRRIFTGSIVALLLAVSSLAAACDVSCAFASMNSDCHSVQTESQNSAHGGMKMDGMTMPGMTMPETGNGEGQQAISAAAPVNASHPSIGALGPCEKQACNDNSGVSAKTSSSIDSHFHSILVATETLLAAGALTSFHDARDDISTYQFRDRSPLPLSLRI